MAHASIGGRGSISIEKCLFILLITSCTRGPENSAGVWYRTFGQMSPHYESKRE